MPWSFNDAPEWLKNKILGEMEIESIGWIMGKDIRKGRSTDAEICLALHLASLEAPLRHDPGEIFLYISTKCMEDYGMTVPADIRVTKLTRDQELELEHYRHILYRKRGRARSAISDAITNVFGKPRKRAPVAPTVAPARAGQQCLMINFDERVLQQIRTE
jgi:hypothetical protein